MTRKLQKKRISPYLILEKIGELNYTLDLPRDMLQRNVHNVFHISLLTKAPKDSITGRKPIQPPPIIIDSHEELEVEEVIDSRI